MSKEFEEIVLEKLNTLDDRTKSTDKVIEDVILKKLDVLETEVKSNQETIKKLNDSFTVFDFEINKKVDTLFDAITSNNDKHEVFEKSIVSLNTKTFNHDIRISILEDYSKNAKIFAAT